jgi:hypothetical protein
MVNKKRIKAAKIATFILAFRVFDQRAAMVDFCSLSLASVS